MNRLVKATLKKALTNDKYNDLQTNYRQAVINVNRKKKEQEIIAEAKRQEKLLKEEELKAIKEEKLAKKLELKEENKIKTSNNRKIKMFHENFREIMECHNIYASEDNTITPFNIELLTAEGADGVSCDLAFPKGLSPSDLDKTTKSLAENVFGKCMVFIEDDNGKHVKFSAIKTWHDIKYDPYLKHDGKKLTASQLFCGYDIRLKPIIIDMAKNPHAMVTGGTGGGNVELPS